MPIVLLDAYFVTPRDSKGPTCRDCVSRLENIVNIIPVLNELRTACEDLWVRGCEVPPFFASVLGGGCMISFRPSLVYPFKHFSNIRCLEF